MWYFIKIFHTNSTTSLSIILIYFEFTLFLFNFNVKSEVVVLYTDGIVRCMASAFRLMNIFKTRSLIVDMLVIWFGICTWLVINGTFFQ